MNIKQAEAKQLFAGQMDPIRRAGIRRTIESRFAVQAICKNSAITLQEPEVTMLSQG
jgi:hypothetical protein